MSLTLGIDLGTTSVAVAIVDTETRLPVATSTAEAPARVRGTVPGSAEVDVDIVLATLLKTLAALPDAQRREVECVGVTGQMHGVMLWHSETYQHSRLITWQDRRAEIDGFLLRLRERARDPRVASGYGCVTLAWYQAYESEIFAEYDRAGTIADYLVAWICERQEALMDPAMAHSWGMFDLQQRSFSEGRCKRAGVPMRMLPRVVESGSKAGELSTAWAKEWGLQPGIPVSVATGDNPASIYGSLRDPESEIALTVGTAAQLGVVVPVGATLPAATIPSVEYRPYLDDRVLVVAAALVGGEAMGWLVNTLRRWCQDIGLEPPDDETLFARVNELGIDGLQSRTAPGGLEAVTSFRGERNNPALDGAITGINMENFSLGNLSVALCRSMLQNVRDMMPEELLAERKRLVCSGNGIRQSPLIRKLAVEEFGLPITLPAHREEAATGVALLAADRLLPAMKAVPLGR